MSIWENQSNEFRGSITDSIRRWQDVRARKERSTQRKEKIKRLYDKR
jgi:hypothetical protein